MNLLRWPLLSSDRFLTVDKSLGLFALRQSCSYPLQETEFMLLLHAETFWLVCEVAVLRSFLISSAALRSHISLCVYHASVVSNFYVSGYYYCYCVAQMRLHLQTHLSSTPRLPANGIVKVPAVERALREVDRGNFVPHSPYQDSPQPIGYNVTVSAPHMHSYCLDQLYNHCKLGGTVLDIGCGSGIFTALLSALASHGATVIGLDHIPELVELSRRNTEKAYKQVIGMYTAAGAATCYVDGYHHSFRSRRHLCFV